MKRYWRLFVGIVVALSVSVFHVAWAQEKVMIGHSNLRNDIAALWVPKDLGIFRKNGLDASIILVTGGVRMTLAIVGNSVPMGFTGATLVASSVAGEIGRAHV